MLAPRAFEIARLTSGVRRSLIGNGRQPLEDARAFSRQLSHFVSLASVTREFVESVRADIEMAVADLGSQVAEHIVVARA